MSVGQSAQDRDRAAKARVWERFAPQHKQESDPCAYAPVPCRCVSPIAGDLVYSPGLVRYAAQVAEGMRRNDRR